MSTHPAIPFLFRDDAAFMADLPYDPEVLLFDEMLELDREKNLIRCRMHTHDELPLTRSQRAHPRLHPRHVAGGLMVHATGMLGFVHAYYMLGLRHHEGWIGYGTHIHKVVFRKLVVPGTPIDAVCSVVRARIGQVRHLVRYRFDFFHEGALCYEGEQTAVWLKIDPNDPAATASLGDG
ncbi:MAG: hotdog fold domain-containing protein [Byssovorax sp.]